MKTVRFPLTRLILRSGDLMKEILIRLLLAVALTMNTPVVAQTYDQAITAWGKADYKTAFSIFNKMAEQGKANGQYGLGMMYAEGIGVPLNDQQAVAWYRKAAEQGHAGAQFQLALMYANGRGAPKNDQQAYFWLLLASAQGVSQAAEFRDSVEKLLSPQQREKAQNLASDWKPSSPQK